MNTSRLPVLTPKSDFFRKNDASFCLQCLDFLRREGRGCRSGAPTLLFQMLCNPVGMFLHKCVNVRLREAHGGADQHAAVFCDLQSQGFPLGADKFVIFLVVRISRLVGKVKRYDLFRRCGLCVENTTKT